MPTWNPSRTLRHETLQKRATFHTNLYCKDEYWIDASLLDDSDTDVFTVFSTTPVHIGYQMPHLVLSWRRFTTSKHLLMQPLRLVNHLQHCCNCGN
jgi:hypothetical protein